MNDTMYSKWCFDAVVEYEVLEKAFKVILIIEVEALE